MTKQPSYLVRRLRFYSMIVLYPVSVSLIVLEQGAKFGKMFCREFMFQLRQLNDMTQQMALFGTCTLPEEEAPVWPKPLSQRTPVDYVEPDLSTWN